MVFQYQYQYQYQLQRGLGMITYDSFYHLLQDVPSNPVLLSFIIAVVPLLLFLLRGRIVKTSAYRTLHALYVKRREEKLMKEAKEIFEESFLGRKKRDVASIFLIAAVLLMGGLILSKSLFFVAVTSNSMAPTFWSGDVVLVQSISKDYQKGDIAVFQNPEVSYENKVIHRIASTKDGRIRTKGDNNNYVDSWTLKEEDILGTAVTVNGRPVVGKKVGRYFISGFDPFKERDPLYRSIKDLVRNIHTYGPLYLIGIFLLILLSLLQGPEKSKVY